MIKIFLFSSPDIYISYRFDNMSSMWKFLDSIEYTVYNFHILHYVDGKPFTYSIWFRSAVVEFINTPAVLRQKFLV